MLMTSKCVDSEVIIEVSGLESGPPLIELTYGNDEHRTKMHVEEFADTCAEANGLGCHAGC
jgi:hypothetical protein